MYDSLLYQIARAISRLFFDLVNCYASDVIREGYGRFTHCRRYLGAVL